MKTRRPYNGAARGDIRLRNGSGPPNVALGTRSRKPIPFAPSLWSTWRDLETSDTERADLRRCWWLPKAIANVETPAGDLVFIRGGRR